MDTHHYLQRLESEWPEVIRRALAELRHAYPAEQIYAAAFWHFYFDRDDIHPPTQGANAESELQTASEYGDTRWSPANWRWDQVPIARNAMMPLYQELSQAMAGASDAEWEALEAAHFKSIARVTRSVTQLVRRRETCFGDLALPSGFVIVALDGQAADREAYNALVRASVDETILPTLKGILI